jgi:hypothetical protein
LIAGRRFSWTDRPICVANDKGAGVDYIEAMRMLIVVFVPLFALLVASVWFAVSAWMHLGGDIPFYGYLAIAGGVLVSLAVGGRADGAGILFQSPRL